MKRYLLAACVVLVLAAAMAGILRATTRRAGGTPPVQAFLDAKMRALPELVSADLGAPKPDYPGTQYLYVTGTASDIPGLIKAEWEAGLLAASLADSGLTDVSGFLVTIRDPSGRVMEENGTEVPPSTLVPTSVLPETTIAKRLPGVQFLHVEDIEAIVHARTPDPAGFALHFPDRLVTILGDDQGYDARLIRIDDERGRPVVVQASVNRLTWRMTWVNPAYGSNPEVAPRSSSAFQRPVSVVEAGRNS